MTQDSGNSPTAGPTDTAALLMGAFQRGLGLKEAASPETIVRGLLAEWDSIGHMELVMEIESTFRIHLADEDVLSLDSFERALEMVSGAGEVGA